MKQILLTLLAFILIHLSAFTQGLGIEGAFNLSKINGAYFYSKPKFLPGFQAGIMSINNIAMGAIYDVSLYSSFTYTQRGYIDRDSSFRFHVNYLEISTLYSVESDNDFATVFSGIGPYAGLGLNAYKEYEDSTVEIGFQKSNISPPKIDFGFNVNAGMYFGKFCITLNYSQSLITLLSRSSNDFRSTQISLHFAYLFWQYLE
jgi:hypothetical protein